MLEKGSLFSPASHVSTARLKDKRQSFGDNVFVFRGCFCLADIFLSLISHAWHCLIVEPQHRGGKMWRLFLVVVVVSVDIFADG